MSGQAARAHRERAAEVDREHPVEVGRWDRIQLAPAGDAGVVHDGVQPPEAVERGLHHRSTVDRHVVCICNGFAAGRADLGDDCVRHRGGAARRRGCRRRSR